MTADPTPLPLGYTEDPEQIRRLYAAADALWPAACERWPQETADAQELAALDDESPRGMAVVYDASHDRYHFVFVGRDVGSVAGATVRGES